MSDRTEANRRYRQSEAGKAARARYRASEAGKVAKARYKATDTGKAAKTRWKVRYKATEHGRAATLAGKARTKRAHVDRRPFIGVDGEGSGTDDKGRQCYRLMRAKGADYDAELFTGRPLQTWECLDFICRLPADTVLVGFSVGYDATMIFRDLPAERLARLFADKTAGPGHSRYVWFGSFGIEYLAKNYLRVARVCPVTRYRPDGTEYKTRETIPGSSRTIWETFGFFQKSFLKCIDSFGVATEAETAIIDRMKAKRGTFEADIGQDVRDYCGLECDLLSRLLTVFRGLCLDVQLRPRSWNGAGKLAAALHTTHATMTAKRLAEVTPPAVLALASAAYYGGRFEVTRTGMLVGPIYENDIQSAYPAAMTTLPCLEHGRWEEAPLAWLRSPPPDAVYVASVRFRHDIPTGGRATLCGLPVRQKSGRICWPMQGNGIYWSVELAAAAKLGCRVTPKSGWRLVRDCDCQPFAWMSELFNYRRSIGKALKGEPIKYAINSAYGKLAQRIGAPKWANPIWAGLITATVRAWIMDAAALDPAGVVMIATDGIMSLRSLAVDAGDNLGQWETAVHDRLTIVQPGVYFGAKKPKTRGVSPAFFEAHPVDYGPPWIPRERFEDVWRDYAEAARASVAPAGLKPPVASLAVTLFIGAKLAVARGKPDTAGCWVTKPRRFSFDWSAKRARPVWEMPLHVWTYPLPGGADVHSEPHKGTRALLAAVSADLERAELDDQPDYFDLSPV